MASIILTALSIAMLFVSAMASESPVSAPETTVIELTPSPSPVTLSSKTNGHHPSPPATSLIDLTPSPSPVILSSKTKRRPPSDPPASEPATSIIELPPSPSPITLSSKTNGPPPSPPASSPISVSPFDGFAPAPAPNGAVSNKVTVGSFAFGFLVLALSV